MRTTLAIIAFAASASAFADAPAPLLVDPFVPPTVAKKRAVAGSEPPSSGAELRAQVERKLRSGFEAADVERRGSITLAQAQAAGLGRVARDFSRIDATRSGRVSFEDYRRFLVAQGAAASLLPAVPDPPPR